MKPLIETLIRMGIPYRAIVVCLEYLYGVYTSGDDPEKYIEAAEAQLGKTVDRNATVTREEMRNILHQAEALKMWGDEIEIKSAMETLLRLGKRKDKVVKYLTEKMGLKEDVALSYLQDVTSMSPDRIKK